MNTHLLHLSDNDGLDNGMSEEKSDLDYIGMCYVAGGNISCFSNVPKQIIMKFEESVYAVRIRI